MESFENYWENPEWLSHIIQDVFNIVYNETLAIIKGKLYEVLKILYVKDLDDKIFDRYYLKDSKVLES